MDWITNVTGNAAFISSIVAIVAAALVIWRSGSIHPIYTRVLRLFISRDEVEDPIVKQSLADQAAVVSLRVAHGVKVETLADARALVTFANEKNIPLYLVGMAGDSFDIRALSMQPRKMLSKWLAPIPVAITLTTTFLICMFALLAASDDLLISLKKTGTWMLISPTEARTAFPPLFGGRGEFSRSACGESLDNSVSPNGFDPRDPEILCRVWDDPKLEPTIARDVPKQRLAAIVFTGVLLPPMLFSAAAFRQWMAATRLSAMIRPLEKSDSRKKFRRRPRRRASES